jgi:hypothetical protein
MTRGQRGRRLAKVELAGAAFLGLVLAPFQYVAAPGWMGPQPPAWQTVGPFVVGSLGIAFGLIWMIRIYRADPEPDQRSWRYRERD